METELGDLKKRHHQGLLSTVFWREELARGRWLQARLQPARKYLQARRHWDRVDLVLRLVQRMEDPSHDSFLVGSLNQQVTEARLLFLEETRCLAEAVLLDWRNACVSHQPGL